ncbi:MAG: protein kinase [Planctomycetes bacterium]|nr:protein kinase [Planctomycetota bacterium]MCB9888638.1 protein kinase [Planctomycetota bacterium]
MQELLAAINALEAYRARQRNGTAESEDRFLADREQLREFLVPLLGSSSHTTPASAVPTSSRDGPRPAGCGWLEEGGDFGSHRIEAWLGRGGMGMVYRATHRELGRTVALKLIAPERVHSASARERFRREAKIASRLDHAAICPIYEVGEVDGMPFLAMRFLDGHSLAEKIAAAGASAPTLEQLLGWIETVARALHHAHEHGVLHRDVKPSNILIDATDAPFILDFGLARDEASDEMQLTVSGDELGTPGYMAPEQIAPRGRAIGRTADVWGLGVTLYECVAGRRPFIGTTHQELREAILRADPQPASGHNRRLPRDLDVVLGKALQADPAHRYATALAFAEDLVRVRDGIPVLARRPRAWLRVSRWTRRNPLPAALLTLLTASLAIAWSQVVEAMAARDDAVSAQQDATTAEGQARAAATEAQRLRGEVLFRMAKARSSVGEWQAAESLYRNAADLGADPIAVQIGLIEVWDGSFELAKSRAAIGALKVHQDLGEHAAKASLLAADPSRRLLDATSFSIDQRAITTALESGTLATADDAYARALLANSAAQVRSHLSAALAADPGHRPAHEMWLTLVLLTEGPVAALADVERFHARYPGDLSAALMRGICRAAMGEHDAAMAAVAGDHVSPAARLRVVQFERLYGALQDSFSMLQENTWQLWAFPDTAPKTSAWDVLSRGMSKIFGALATGGGRSGELHVRFPPCSIRALLLTVTQTMFPFATPQSKVSRLDWAIEIQGLTMLRYLRAGLNLKLGHSERAIRDFVAASEGKDLMGTQAVSMTLRISHAALLSFEAAEAGQTALAERARGWARSGIERRLLTAKLHCLEFHFLAKVAMGIQDLSLASVCAARWSRAYPDDPHAVTCRARLWVRHGRLGSARESVAAGRKRWPAHRALRELGDEIERLSAGRRAVK